MKVRVSYVVTVTDEVRRAIRRHYGRKGMATRAEVVNWFIAHGETMDLQLMNEHSDEATAKIEAAEAEAERALEAEKTARPRRLRKVAGQDSGGA